MPAGSEITARIAGTMRPRNTDLPPWRSNQPNTRSSSCGVTVSPAPVARAARCSTRLCAPAAPGVIPGHLRRHRAQHGGGDHAGQAEIVARRDEAAERRHDLARDRRKQIRDQQQQEHPAIAERAETMLERFDHAADSDGPSVIGRDALGGRIFEMQRLAGPSDREGAAWAALAASAKPVRISFSLPG